MESEYSKAGEIGSDVINIVHKWVKPGEKLSSIADRVEEEIVNLGGQPAFPVSVAVNEVAAHYAPLYGDDSVIPSNALVKVDLGVHIDGKICDCARTVAIGEYPHDLYNATLEALKTARDILRPGITLSEFGAEIESTIRSHGVLPIFNLSGHLMSDYIIHAGLSIPNTNNASTVKLEEGMHVAIEPFATNGSSGYVKDEGEPCIFAFESYKNVRNPSARALMLDYYKSRKTLPFAQRWVIRDFGKFKGQSALNFLMKDGVLISYPPLVESSRGWVSQFEASFFISSEGVEIIGGPREVF